MCAKDDGRERGDRQRRKILKVEIHLSIFRDWG